MTFVHLIDIKIILFRFSGLKYSLIILYDDRLKQNSKVFLEENFLKRHETAVVDKLGRGVRNK